MKTWYEVIFLHRAAQTNILTHQWCGDFDANLRHFANNRDEIVNNKIAFTPSSSLHSSFKIYAYAVSSAGHLFVLECVVVAITHRWLENASATLCVVAILDESSSLIGCRVALCLLLTNQKAKFFYCKQQFLGNDVTGRSHFHWNNRQLRCVSFSTVSRANFCRLTDCNPIFAMESWSATISRKIQPCCDAIQVAVAQTLVPRFSVVHWGRPI